MIDFTEEQLERYSRHILLKDVGIEGQELIMKSKVLIIGAGGLGAPVALYLAAAGVGTIGIADGDNVDLSNLQRQIIHFTPDVALLMSDNIGQIIREYDFVIDGTDNFASKFLINDACILEKKPLSHGGILRFTGQTMTIVPGESACYRCVFNEPPPKDSVPTCSEAGVLGAIAGMLGTIQAAEALKYITGAGNVLTNNLLTFDALNMDFRKVQLRKRNDCPVCGQNPSIKELYDEEQAVCDLKSRGH